MIWKSLGSSVWKEGWQKRHQTSKNPDLVRRNSTRTTKYVTILDGTQVWGESWEQVVVDATLWRTALAVIW
jgi:hypothetical protein